MNVYSNDFVLFLTHDWGLGKNPYSYYFAFKF
jgi:hypothetical protein